MATSHCPLPISKEDYKEILCRFLSKNAFKTAKNDPDIEKTILNRFLKYDEISEAKAKYLAVHGASSAEHFYPLHQKEIRQAVAFYTAYLGAIDDLGPDFLADLRRFRHDIFHETPQIPLLRDYKKLCEEFGEYYTAFSTDKITVGMINFTSSTVLEAETHDFKKLSTAPNFPHYFRFMTGLVEAYAWLLLPKDICSPTSFDLFIQIVPDIMDYTNAVNDLLSFYKESIVSNERNNPVYLRAQQNTSQISDVLCSLSEEIDVYVTRIKASASDDKILSQIVDPYLQGYVGFHVSQPRYRLEELGLSLCDIQSNP